MTNERVTPVERFRALFSGRESAHGRMSITADGEKKAATKREPTPTEAWDEHLDGSGPFLGQIPIREDGTCLFAAIDVDDKEIDHFALAQKVRDLHLPLIVCRSKSGGAHLYAFFKEPIPADKVIERLKRFAKLLDVKNPDGRDVEIFPKQAKITAKQTGNWINLPYYGGNATERWAIIGGEKADLVTFLTSAWSRRSTAEEFLGMADPVGDLVFSDGPPCLRTLHSGGVPEGTRNITLFNMGMYFRLRDEDHWEEHLEQYNARYSDPPLPKSELHGLIDNINKGTYTYQCDQPPLSTECKLRECHKQRYGVKAFREMKRAEHLLHAMPDFGGLTHVQGDPATFLLPVNGVVITMDIDTLLTVTKFRKHVMSVGAGCWIPSMKQSEWEAILHPLYENRSVMTAPPSATTYGIFKGHMNDYLNSAQESDDLSSLHLGHPVLANGTIYFRVVDLDAFLKRRSFRDYDPSELFLRIQEAFGTVTEITMDGNTAVWTITAPPHLLQTQDIREPAAMPEVADGDY